MDNLSSTQNKNSSIVSAAIPFLVISALFAGLALGVVGTWVATNIFFKQTSVQNNTQTDLKTNFDSSSKYSEEYINLIYSILDKYYIGSTSDSKKATYEIIKGIVKSLNDPYITFLDPEETKSYKESLGGDFEGVGMELGYNGENTLIQSIIDGTPASKSKLKNGDIIISVDDEDVRGKKPSYVATKIRGKKDTTVKIGYFRNNQVFTENLTRDKIDVSRITWKKVDEDTVEIDISQFVDESVPKFISNWDKVVSEIKAQVPKTNSVIVDLRSNPGGYVSAVRYVLEDFLQTDQVIMMEQEKGKDKIVYKDKRVGAFEDKNIKIIVIVDEGSASASEIFASAIQDNKRGIVIGKKTVGKGVEQTVIDSFEDGSMFIVPFQSWVTPNGRIINKENPITPDQEVEFDTQLFDKSGADSQYNKAVEIANK